MLSFWEFMITIRLAQGLSILYRYLENSLIVEEVTHLIIYLSSLDVENQHFIANDLLEIIMVVKSCILFYFFLLMLPHFFLDGIRLFLLSTFSSDSSLFSDFCLWVNRSSFLRKFLFLSLFLTLLLCFWFPWTLGRRAELEPFIREIISFLFGLLYFEYFMNVFAKLRSRHPVFPFLSFSLLFFEKKIVVIFSTPFSQKTQETSNLNIEFLITIFIY